VKTFYKLLFFASIAVVSVSMFYPVIYTPVFGNTMYFIALGVFFTFPVLLLIGILIYYAKR
jgi:hypothetical protein